MKETELKFLVDPEQAASIEAALRRRAARTVSIESRYFDTADRRLAEAGVSLRLRKTGRLWEQTLKAPGASAIERQEETIVRRGRWGPDGPPIEPALHGQTAAGKRLFALLDTGDRTDANLQAAYVTQVSRLSVEIEVDDGRVEVAFDRGAIRAEGRSTPICEVEYELKSGAVAALLAIARAGVVAHRMSLCAVSKAARGDRLARGDPAGPPSKAQAPDVEGSMAAPALLRAIVAACVDQVLGNASEIALGHLSDELVHELRVGLRRLRTASRELAALDPLLDPRWEAGFASAFRALGSYRDRTSVAAATGRRLAAAGSPAALQRPTGDLPDPLATVRSESFQCALLDALAAVLEPPRSGADRPPSVDALIHIGARLGRLHGRLAREAKSFAKLGESQRHSVRKRLKRLRYLSELVAALYRGKEVGRFLAKLKPAQDELGTYIDLAVSIEMARAAAMAGDAGAWFNVGWLTAQQARRIKRCRRVLERAAKARPFWQG